MRMSPLKSISVTTVASGLLISTSADTSSAAVNDRTLPLPLVFGSGNLSTGVCQRGGKQTKFPRDPMSHLYVVSAVGFDVGPRAGCDQRRNVLTADVWPSYGHPEGFGVEAQGMGEARRAVEGEPRREINMRTPVAVKIQGRVAHAQVIAASHQQRQIEAEAVEADQPRGIDRRVERRAGTDRPPELLQCFALALHGVARDHRWALFTIEHPAQDDNPA